jgi:hypothetical protein
MLAKQRLLIALPMLLTGSFACGQEWIALTQTCDPEIQASAPSARFRQNAAGTATDRQTGKTWMRCTLGQKWTGAVCSGSPLKISWAGAFDAVDEFNRRGGYGDHADWRLPTLMELASLVEHRCHDPAINLEIFPATPVTGFWSASPHASPDHAMLIHFKYGGQYMGNKSQDWALRLVRD